MDYKVILSNLVKRQLDDILFYIYATPGNEIVAVHHPQLRPRRFQDHIRPTIADTLRHLLDHMAVFPFLSV